MCNCKVDTRGGLYLLLVNEGYGNYTKKEFSSLSDIWKHLQRGDVYSEFIITKGIYTVLKESE